MSLESQRKGGAEKVCEEIMAKNCPNLAKVLNPKIKKLR